MPSSVFTYFILLSQNWTAHIQFAQSALQSFGEHLDINNPWIVTIIGGTIGAVFAGIVIYCLLEREKDKRAEKSEQETHAQAKERLARQIDDADSLLESKKYKESLAKYNTLSKDAPDSETYGHIKAHSGICLFNLAILGHKKEDRLEKAVQTYKEALKSFTLKTYPMNYATPQNNLGNAYRTLSKVRDKEKNLAKAINAYEESLKIYTVESYPVNYATPQNNLGITYSTLSEVRDKEKNLAKAINAYEESLKIYTVESYPVNYATTVTTQVP